MWNHLPRTILAVATFLSVALDLSADSKSCRHRSRHASDRSSSSTCPLSSQAATTWATDLFDQAGFDLPPIRYVFHGDTPEPCAGRPGLHHPVEGVNVIEICTAEMSLPTQVMILHETAHAWIDHTLTDERKAAFQQLRGWTYWRELRRSRLARQRHRAGR